MAMISRAVLRTQPDGTLATLAAAGSEPAFEVIVHRYRRPLLRYCRRLALSENRSEDVVQQTFLNAWGSLRQGSEVRELRPWLYRITHNQAITLLRAAGRDDTPLSELMEASTVAATAVSAGVDDVFEGQARLREALSAVAALPALQREALLATAVDGLSYDEAAGALNTSADAVRGLVYRARNALRTGVAVLSPAPLVVWAANGAGSAITAPALQQWVSDVGAGTGTAGLSLAAATRGVAVLVSSAAVVGGTAVGITEHGATSSPRSSRSLRSAAAPRPTGSSHAGTGASHRTLASGPATTAGAPAGSVPTGQREARRSGAVFTAAAVHTGDAVGTGVLSTGASAVARSISTPTRTPAPQAGGRPTASSSRGDDGSGSGVPPAAGDRAWAPQGQAALTPSLRSAAGSDAVMPPADGSGWSPGSRGASGVQTASPRAAGPPGNSGAEGMTGSAGPGATGGSTTPADPSASTTAATPTTATPTTATTTTATTPTTTATTPSATGASPTGASPASSVTSTTPATATTPALDTATALLGAATSSAADAG